MLKIKAKSALALVLALLMGGAALGFKTAVKKSCCAHSCPMESRRAPSCCPAAPPQERIAASHTDFSPQWAVLPSLPALSSEGFSSPVEGQTPASPSFRLFAPSGLSPPVA